LTFGVSTERDTRVVTVRDRKRRLQISRRQIKNTIDVSERHPRLNNRHIGNIEWRFGAEITDEYFVRIDFVHSPSMLKLSKQKHAQKHKNCDEDESDYFYKQWSLFFHIEYYKISARILRRPSMLGMCEIFVGVHAKNRTDDRPENVHNAERADAERNSRIQHAVTTEK
jgi:hypothetical protein